MTDPAVDAAQVARELVVQRANRPRATRKGPEISGPFFFSDPLRTATVVARGAGRIAALERAGAVRTRKVVIDAEGKRMSHELPLDSLPSAGC